MNLQPPSRLSPPSPLTFLHFSFLPTLSFLPVYLTSLSSPSILHHLPFFPLFLLSIRPSCTCLHFPSSSTPHLPATLSLSFFLSPLSSLSFPSSSSPLLLSFPLYPSVSLHFPSHLIPSLSPSKIFSLLLPPCYLIPLHCALHIPPTMLLSSLHSPSLPVSSCVLHHTP